MFVEISEYCHNMKMFCKLRIFSSFVSVNEFISVDLSNRVENVGLCLVLRT